MKNAIKSFVFLAIGFALGVFTMKSTTDKVPSSETGFAPITKTQSSQQSAQQSAQPSTGFKPIQKDNNNSGFTQIKATPREQALLLENKQLKERVRYLENRLK